MLNVQGSLTERISREVAKTAKHSPKPLRLCGRIPMKGSFMGIDYFCLAANFAIGMALVVGISPEVEYFRNRLARPATDASLPVIFGNLARNAGFILVFAAFLPHTGRLHCPAVGYESAPCIYFKNPLG
jgi:hypothetical protein